MSCSYCLEKFDLNSKLPINLSCSHVYCKECVDMLSDFMRYCPLDGVIVDFETKELNLETIEDLKFKCQKHEVVISGICESCSIFFCMMCQVDHKSCRVFKGSKAMIKVHMLNTLQSVLEKSLAIKDCIKDDQLIEIDDGVVWIEEHLKFLYQALEEINLIKKFRLSEESKKKIMEKYKVIEFKFSSDRIIQESNRVILPSSIPENNIQEQNFFQKFLKDLNEPDEIVSEIKNYLSKQLQNFIITVVKSGKNKEQFNNYFWNFRQKSKTAIYINGFGFGRPSEVNTFLYVDCFEVILNNETLLNDNFIIEYDQHSKTFDYMIRTPIVLVPNVDLLFHVEINGKGNYIFSNCPFNDVEIKGTDNEKFSGPIPILYLIRSS